MRQAEEAGAEHESPDHAARRHPLPHRDGLHLTLVASTCFSVHRSQISNVHTCVDALCFRRWTFEKTPSLLCRRSRKNCRRGRDWSTITSTSRWPISCAWREQRRLATRPRRPVRFLFTTAARCWLVSRSKLLDSLFSVVTIPACCRKERRTCALQATAEGAAWRRRERQSSAGHCSSAPRQLPVLACLCIALRCAYISKINNTGCLAVLNRECKTWQKTKPVV